MASDSRIEVTLDKRHAAARAAFASKDLGAYQSLFASDLQYLLADGTMIDRTRLMQDVKAQFRRLDRAESHFTRERLDVGEGEIRETLLQVVIAEACAFGFLRRIWRVERRGIYSWAAADGELKIVRVQVSGETVASRWKLGR